MLKQVQNSQIMRHLNSLFWLLYKLEFGGVHRSAKYGFYYFILVQLKILARILYLYRPINRPGVAPRVETIRLLHNPVISHV